VTWKKFVKSLLSPIVNFRWHDNWYQEHKIVGTKLNWLVKKTNLC